MRTIILAAGQSQRFKEAGYEIPKPFLHIHWRGTTLTMIEHVINTVPINSKIIVGVPKGWLNQTTAFANQHTYLDITSKGPADTALQIMKKLQPDNTLILDSDVLNFTNDLVRLTFLSRCGVLVRNSTNPASSYVEKLGVFKHIVEKKQISQYAVQGAYYIPIIMWDSFIDALHSMTQVMQEPYISHALNFMKNEKFSTHVSYTPIEWGTPRDIRISGAHIVKEEAEDAYNRSHQHSGCTT